MFRKRRVVLTCWAPSKQSYFARLGLKHQFWLSRGVRQLNSPAKGFTPQDSSCQSFRWEWIQLGLPSAFIIFPSSLVFAFSIVHLTLFEFHFSLFVMTQGKRSLSSELVWPKGCQCCWYQAVLICLLYLNKLSFSQKYHRHPSPWGMEKLHYEYTDDNSPGSAGFIAFVIF